MSISIRGALARPALAALCAASILVGCGGGGPDAAAPMARTQAAAAPTPAGSAAYVSPQGSDAADGSKASPWRTLTYAVSKLPAGVTLYARGGTYAETLTIWRSGITIAAYPQEQPVIDGATVAVPSWWGLLQIYGNNVTVTGFELRNINVDGHGGLGGTAVVQGGVGAMVYGNNAIIAGMTIHDTWAQGVFVKGDASIVSDMVVHDVAMSNCRTAGRANCSPASTVASGWPSCVSIASDFGSGRITHGGVIARTQVYNCWGEGISTWLSDGVTIEDNTTYDNWAENLYVDNATNTLVQRNLVYNTPGNLVGKRAGFALADETTTTTQPNPVSSHNTVINNLVYNANFSAYNWTLVNNTGLVDDIIAHNTFVSTDPAYDAFDTGGPANNVPVLNAGTLIADNIVLGGAKVPSAAGITFSHNLWTGAAPGAGAGPGDALAPNAAAVIMQLGTTQPGTLAPSYFMLTGTSVAHSHGITLSQVTTDFHGGTLASPPDIGAF